MLTTGEVRVERRFLERRADDLPHRRPLPDDVIAADGRRACGRREQRREHVHRRRLARTVGAEKAVDLARVDVQIDAVDRTRALLELTDEAVGLDAGGEHFALLDCLNDSAEGVTLLQQLVERELEGWRPPT